MNVHHGRRAAAYCNASLQSSGAETWYIFRRLQLLFWVSVVCIVSIEALDHLRAFLHPYGTRNRCVWKHTIQPFASSHATALSFTSRTLRRCATAELNLQSNLEGHGKFLGLETSLEAVGQDVPCHLWDQKFHNVHNIQSPIERQLKTIQILITIK
jgi:hypothetical protein